MTEHAFANFANPEPPARPTVAPEPTVLRFSSPEGLLAAIPYLWGFHPTDSLVVLGLSGPADRQRDCCGARLDLPSSVDDLADAGIPHAGGGCPHGLAGDQHGDGDSIDSTDPIDPADPVDPIDRADLADLALRRMAGSIAAELVRCGAQRVLLVAYSDDVVVAERVVDAVGMAVTAVGIPVAEALRADGRRWWSYLCADPACCSPDGTPYDLSANQVTAAAVFAGHHAYADRDEVWDLVRPLLGDTREAMLEATERAEDQLTSMWAEVFGRTGGREVDVDAVPERCAVIVRKLVSRLVAEAAAPSEDEAALLSVFTASLQVRDAAWFLITEDNAERQLELWRWVAQRAVPPYEPAPAALLAFAAWLTGNNVLARFAVERAFESDPDYGLAQIVDDAMRRGVPPTIWRQVRADGDPTVDSSLYSQMTPADPRFVEPGSCGCPPTAPEGGPMTAG